MIPLIAATMLGPWTYAGFLDEPASHPQPPAVVVPDDPAVPAPDEAGPVDPGPAVAPEIPPEPEGPPAPKASAPPAVPATYRLADAWGQTWEHADPGFLQNWVDVRNRSLNAFSTRTPGARSASR